MVLADLVFPEALRRSRAQQRAVDVLLILIGSLFTAMMAQIAIPLPFTPVPITGQTLAVLLTGAALGSRRGALSMVAYVLEGSLGLPVFAGGTAGLKRLTGPTGGYLIGFIAAAFVTGWLAERGWDRRPLSTALAMLAGNVVIYLFGLPWLAMFLGGFLGPKGALVLGLLPFIPGDLLKLFLATLLLPSVWGVVRNIRRER
ncbi:biotin transporter BioY [Thermoflexus sp.]|uniref:biotin transporter BioY n=1 Tax=Thermoflexus sp. TaxID=1969742 RepID=UPI0035E4616F